MFHGNLDHYFSCGASAFNIISAAIGLSGLSRIDSILDFGSGAGRVTRWLRAGYPNAHLSVTDIRTSDLAFCGREFSVSSWASRVSTEELSAPRHYDVIWVGSVITHLPETLSIRLIHKLLSWLNPNGVLVLSMHGRFARSNGPRAHNYGVEGRWTEIEQGYEGSVGYGYADYPFQTDFGISLAKPSWTARLIEAMSGFRLVLFSERAWDDHHDVVAIQNTSVADTPAPKVHPSHNRNGMIQQRVVSVHFPKAAGSSLHLQLATYLGDAVDLDITHDPLTPSGAETEIFPSGKRIVHGHFRAQRYASARAYWMTFLRHPVDNLISIYFYWKSITTPSHDLHQRFLREQPSILDFAKYPGIQRLMSDTYFGGFDMNRFDFIGFYETRDVDIPRLASSLGLPLVAETHIHKTIGSAERLSVEADASIRQSLADLLTEDMVFYERLRNGTVQRSGGASG